MSTPGLWRAITVSINQLPDPSQSFAGKLGLHHLILGSSTCHFSILLLQRIEDFVILWFVPRHNPGVLICPLHDSNLSSRHFHLFKHSSNNLCFTISRLVLFFCWH